MYFRKKVSDLLKDVSYTLLQGSDQTEVSSLVYDSRRSKDGSLFIAVQGYTSDGHDYINQAVSQGAICIIVEKEIALPDDVTVIKVNDSRKTMAIISCEFYNHPSGKLKVVGITGTNGKTTTIHLMQSVYELAGYKVGLIGTIGVSINGEQITIPNTTPESVDLHSLFAEMLKRGVDYCFIEVSSHALALDRVHGTFFYGTIFTNLSPDHLEFHKDMEDYFLAKKKLFAMDSQHIIVNDDDAYGKIIINELKSKKEESKLTTYGCSSGAEISADNILQSAHNTNFTLKMPRSSAETLLHLPGEFNIYNSLAAAAFAYSDNIDPVLIASGISKTKSVKGRFELIYQDHDFRVIIDFAHTEQSLENIICSVRKYTTGRIILVFGVYVAGEGEKGKYKRLGMGKIAGKYADQIIITSDNPKKQDPQMIVDQIAIGVAEENENYEKIIDRKTAIERAVMIAKNDDVVLITGKGHETAQIIGDRAIPFNEKEIVMDAIDNKKKRQGKNE